MTYEACLMATFLNLQSWAIAAVGLILAFVAWRLKRRFIAAVAFGQGLILALLWAYLHYNFNCVELIGI